MLKSSIARDYRKKFPKATNLGLARILYKENNEVYKNVEDARRFVRHIEGKSGATNKKYLKDKSLVLEGERPRNPYNLPDSEETDYKPYIIKGHRKIAVFADIHIPYHSIEALSLAIREAKKEKVDAVLLLGDFLDFYQLSRFDKDPRKRSVAHELEAARQVLGILKKELNCKIYYKLGNHCERYEKYLMVKAPELLGIAEFELENLLRLKDYNAVVITDKRVIKINKLNLIHGHEYVGGIFSPVNVARGLYTRGKVSAMQGHNHQTSSHSERDMDGRITTTWSLGCLCELAPRYMPLNRWGWGFGLIDVDPNGKDYHVRNLQIHKGKIF